MSIKRLFVVSDVHGHYTQMKQALDAEGFDPNNEDHIFICCGDLFDRGCENRRIYDFVRRLKRKVLIRGNHDVRLGEILEQRMMNDYDIYNGVDITLVEFFGREGLSCSGELIIPRYNKMFGKLSRLLNSMVDYYETDKYVFVHGWLPMVSTRRPARLLSNWRDVGQQEWASARYGEWVQYYGVNDILPGKTIVCGHRPTRLAYAFDPSREVGDSSIFYGDGVIAIDAGTVRSGRVNVLVLEDEL